MTVEGLARRVANLESRIQTRDDVCPVVRIDFDACRNEEEKNAAIRAELAKLPPHRRPHSILLVSKRMSGSEWDET